MNTLKMKKNFVALILLCAAFMFSPSQVDAAIIDINFTGVVYGFSGLTAFAADVPVSINDTVVGSWSYDTNAPFEGTWFDDPNISFHFSIASTRGGLTFNYDGTNPSMTVNYGMKDHLAVADHEFSGTNGSITATEFVSSYSGSISDWLPSAGVMFFDSISGAPLPETLSNLFWHLQYDTFTSSNSHTGGGIYIDVVSAKFNSRTQVPEPATILLLGLSFIGLAGLRGKWQK